MRSKARVVVRLFTSNAVGGNTATVPHDNRADNCISYSQGDSALVLLYARENVADNTVSKKVSLEAATPDWKLANTYKYILPNSYLTGRWLGISFWLAS